MLANLLGKASVCAPSWKAICTKKRLLVFQGPSFHADGKSASSVDDKFELASLISAAGTEPQCYNHGTQLRSSEGHRIAVEQLKDGDSLTALDGSIVPVRVKRHASPDHTLSQFL